MVVKTGTQQLNFFSFPCAGVGMQSRRASVVGSNLKDATICIEHFIQWEKQLSMSL